MESIVPTDPSKLQETLEHLYKVINGLSFYLNTVGLRRSEVTQCCERYWHGEQSGISCNLHDDIRRLHEISSLTRLMQRVSIPFDPTSMNQIYEHIKTIFPSNPVRSWDSDSCFKTSWLDERLLTSVVLNLLIRVCKGLAIADRHTYHNLQKEIMLIINNRFIRPYTLILWSCAKQELQN